jgi:hypothetical protein
MKFKNLVVKFSPRKIDNFIVKLVKVDSVNVSENSDRSTTINFECGDNNCVNFMFDSSSKNDFDFKNGHILTSEFLNVQNGDKIAIIFLENGVIVESWILHINNPNPKDLCCDQKCDVLFHNNNYSFSWEYNYNRGKYNYECTNNILKMEMEIVVIYE